MTYSVQPSLEDVLVELWSVLLVVKTRDNKSMSWVVGSEVAGLHRHSGFEKRPCYGLLQSGRCLRMAMADLTVSVWNLEKS